MSFDRRTRRFGAAALSVTILGGAAAAALTANPAAAAGIVTAVTTVSCSVTGANWCISGNNSSSGIGVIGTSKSGTGLRGTSTSQYGLKATSVTGTAILAQTTSGVAGISASAATGYGVSGTATSAGIGVFGTTKGGYGVYGTSSSGSGYGVLGYISGSGVGTYGYSSSGNGVDALSSSGTGLLAQTGGSGTGAQITSSSGYGIIARSAGATTVYARNTNGNAVDSQGTYIGVVSRAPSSGFPFVATDPSGNNLFYVDGKGNLSYHGGLFHFAHIVGGATVKSYTPSSSVPVVEDTGTAQLVGGAAAVRLDPTFAASIDPTSGYRVFVTPSGDTHGLFVATRTPSGFVIREAQGGRSTVSFDYRIVATAAGQAGLRMAVTSDANGAGGSPVAPAFAAPAAPALAPVQPAAALPAAE